MEVLHKTKCKITTPGHIPRQNYNSKKKKKTQKDRCTGMFIAALFTTAKTWKQPECPSTDEWIKETWSINTMEYYSAIKKTKLMSFAATWMDLEMIRLSEVSQAAKDK